MLRASARSLAPAVASAAAGLLLLSSPCPALQGTTTLVSVSSTGGQGSFDSGGVTALSMDGRFVTFPSLASNFVLGDMNGFHDIYVRDRAAGTTLRVSLDSNGQEGSWGSYAPSISADGRFVAFHSESNLVPGDLGWTDVFVRDVQLGITVRTSVTSQGGQAFGQSYPEKISTDSRFVVFNSEASNLVPGDTNGFWDTFVHDLQTGVTERVSVSSTGAQGNSGGAGLAISGDGRYVAFGNPASNLVQGDTNGKQDVFVRDRWLGQTTRVSVSSLG